MAERKRFLLRLTPDLWDEIQRLAAADMRSVNAEIEVLLREAVRRRGKKIGEFVTDDEDSEGSVE